MKYFIITIDTEGDDQWSWKPGREITTENVKYLPRFQNLCNKYGFKPVWLSNYEMMQDAGYVDFISSVEASGTGELGMHLHAWSTPPFYKLPIQEKGAPYLIEYPDEIMEEKIVKMTETIKQRTGIVPVSHRAGRWATDSRYFSLLDKYGYLADCSVTPHENWKGSIGMTRDFGGTDYTGFPENPYIIEGTNILEVPVTVRNVHSLIFEDTLSVRNIARSFYRVWKGQNLWCNPNRMGLHGLKNIADHISISSKAGDDYLMFFTHSSQLMPGGSPQYRTIESIELLYKKLEAFFQYISRSYVGITLREFYLSELKEMKY
ncbi:MAG: hypothetical protein NC433_05705 [Clostridiales bacterium]|nr:hypothetical protein [Clostridiales bacterium]